MATTLFLQHTHFLSMKCITFQNLPCTDKKMTYVYLYEIAEKTHDNTLKLAILSVPAEPKQK
jgi:hypothetical protein